MVYESVIESFVLANAPQKSSTGFTTNSNTLHAYSLRLRAERVFFQQFKVVLVIQGLTLLNLVKA